MADLLQVFAEARDGNLAIKLSRDFTDLIRGCLNTNQKGEMNIKVSVKPFKRDDGHVEINITCDTKLKVPELGIGTAIFFVDADQNLSRMDPRQAALFEEMESKKQ